MKHNIKKTHITPASLRRDRSAHTVLLRMAQDADRAERIRGLKDAHPDMTWNQIADSVGVSERSVLSWAQKGTMSYDSAKKLAPLFDVDVDWLWSGREREESPELMQQLTGDKTQLDRIEALLTDLQQRLEFIEGVVADGLSREAQGAAREAAEAAADSAAPSRGARASGRKQRRPASGGR